MPHQHTCRIAFSPSSVLLWLLLLHAIVRWQLVHVCCDVESMLPVVKLALVCFAFCPAAVSTDAAAASRGQQSPELLVDLQNLQHRAWSYSSSTSIQRSVVNLASLQLLGTLLPQQTPDKAAGLLLRLVPQYAVHPSAKCRVQFVEMLVDTWQRFAADGIDAAPAAGSGAAQASPQQQQMQQLEEALFFGLADKDGAVYQAVLKFWQDVLPKRLEERLQVRAARCRFHGGVAAAGQLKKRASIRGYGRSFLCAGVFLSRISKCKYIEQLYCESLLSAFAF
jgi:hypothetical protein